MPKQDIGLIPMLFIQREHKPWMHVKLNKLQHIMFSIIVVNRTSVEHQIGKMQHGNYFGVIILMNAILQLIQIAIMNLFCMAQTTQTLMPIAISLAPTRRTFQ